ncbi:unnamed protein product [Phytomonas sp. EM1]|nr:unnamed protein product [Phytomonas sp. EM1]|eukprot:CCW64649.1 unnamed protein product [Phytomonas sp. isolate EM1]
MNHGGSPPPMQQQPFLGRELRVELSDGRVVVGTLVAYQGGGDLLLRECVEQRLYQGDDNEKMEEREVAVRGIDLLAIPFKYVKALHRRTAGQSAVWQEFSAQLRRVEAPKEGESEPPSQKVI